MSYCNICLDKIEAEITWVSLFTTQEKTICKKCTQHLQSIEGNRCLKCSRSLDKLDPTHHENSICLDCKRWENNPQWKNILQSNYSLYEYNDFLKETLARYKYRGDYAIDKAFKAVLHKIITSKQYDRIIPIPLSPERLYERGFNQTSSLLEEASIAYTNYLSRKHSEKQSKKSRSERLNQEQIFQLDQPDLIKNKTILLFDDIYTTGMTLRQAAKLLKSSGAQQIHSITLARG